MAVRGEDPSSSAGPWNHRFWGSSTQSVGHERPGRGGQSPPRLSMARPMRASADRNPKAMRVSEAGFDTGAVGLDRRRELHEGGDATSLSPGEPLPQQRHAGCAAELEDLPQLFLEQVGTVEARVDPLDVGELV